MGHLQLDQRPLEQIHSDLQMHSTTAPQRGKASIETKGPLVKGDAILTIKTN